MEDTPQKRPEITADTVLQDGDRITVTPKNVKGEYLPPKLSDFKRFLRAEGFAEYKSGPGDHEVWQRRDGRKVTVNRAHDKQHVDKASLKSLAQILNREFGEVDRAIRDG